ncbi:hypothetical protein RYX36_027484 [Vicia faba]
MSRPPIMICDLKPKQNVWKIAIRVVDVWNVKEHNGKQHLEAIIQDAKTEQIHVVTLSMTLMFERITCRKTKPTWSITVK